MSAGKGRRMMPIRREGSGRTSELPWGAPHPGSYLARSTEVQDVSGDFGRRARFVDVVAGGKEPEPRLHIIVARLTGRVAGLRGTILVLVRRGRRVGAVSSTGSCGMSCVLRIFFWGGMLLPAGAGEHRVFRRASRLQPPGRRCGLLALRRAARQGQGVDGLRGEGSFSVHQGCVSGTPPTRHVI